MTARDVSIIDSLTKKDLAEVYCALNCYEWDDRLGVKPDGFDDMPDRCSTTIFSRSHYVTPFMREAMRRMSRYEQSMAWHMVRLERSKWQFRHYWVTSIFRRLSM